MLSYTFQYYITNLAIIQANFLQFLFLGVRRVPLLLPQMTVAWKLPLRTKIAIVFMYKANFMLNFTIIMPQIAYLYLFLHQREPSGGKEL